MSDYTLIGNAEFPRYYQAQMPDMSKSECFSKINSEKYEFDYALPQQWLDEFVKKSGLNYHLVLSTTVWVYERKSFVSGAVSCCVEVQRALENYLYNNK